MQRWSEMWLDTWKYNLELAKGVKENMLACHHVSLAPDLQMPYIQNIFFLNAESWMYLFHDYLHVFLHIQVPLWTMANSACAYCKLAWIFHNKHLQNLIIWSYLGALKPSERQWYQYYRAKHSSAWQRFFGALVALQPPQICKLVLLCCVQPV